MADPATDLLAVIPNTPGHTILREIRVVGDHNSYHTGEFAILRQVMGTWPRASRGTRRACRTLRERPRQPIGAESTVESPCRRSSASAINPASSSR